MLGEVSLSLVVECLCPNANTCRAAYMSHTWLSSFFYCSELLVLYEMMMLCNYFLEYYYVLSKEETGSTPSSLFIYATTVGNMFSSSLFLISSVAPLEL